VTGACRDFIPNATHVWVQRALECANATVSTDIQVASAMLLIATVPTGM
jgi:hypothetical protein